MSLADFNFPVQHFVLDLLGFCLCQNTKVATSFVLRVILEFKLLIKIKAIHRPSLKTDLLNVELMKTRIVVTKINFVFVALAANMTHERLLAGVRSSVRLEMMQLRVGATTDATRERLFSGVKSLMKIKAALVGETLAADTTRERLLAVVHPHVLIQLSSGRESFRAGGAYVRPYVGMRGHVRHERTFHDVTLRADGALEGPLSAVTLLVNEQREARLQLLETDVAMKRFRAVRQDVFVQVGGGHEVLTAQVAEVAQRRFDHRIEVVQTAELVFVDRVLLHLGAAAQPATADGAFVFLHLRVMRRRVFLERPLDGERLAAVVAEERLESGVHPHVSLEVAPDGKLSAADFAVERPFVASVRALVPIELRPRVEQQTALVARVRLLRRLRRRRLTSHVTTPDVDLQTRLGAELPSAEDALVALVPVTFDLVTGQFEFAVEFLLVLFRAEFAE